MNVLFVSSEVYPLNKTGGLGDVAYSLPHALSEQGADVKLLVPAYRNLLDKVSDIKLIGHLDVPAYDRVLGVRILQASHPEFSIGIYLADCQPLFDRPGNPYIQDNGLDWPDNAERFTVFSRIATLMALDTLNTNWQADVVHCNDWQSGLVPALLSDHTPRPKTIFTIHNLAYGGYFPQADFQQLQLPTHFWSIEGVEFYGGFSMLKSGIIYADAVTTVSPTYAEEICTPQFGYAMDGILQSRKYKLHGILNGIDSRHWNPLTDTYLPVNYSISNIIEGKHASKKALLESYGIVDLSDSFFEKPLLGMVGRLIEQKGIDLILDCMAEIIQQSDACFIFLGTGATGFEQQLLGAAELYPDRVYVWIGFSEEKAHLLEAGADIFLMPSRFEPCGLNQMYSLHYGTPPVVHNTGGLADTVVNTSQKSLMNGSANGFVFEDADTASFKQAVYSALELFSDKAKWTKIMKNGMSIDFSWDGRAVQYLDLYKT